MHDTLRKRLDDYDAEFGDLEVSWVREFFLFFEELVPYIFDYDKNNEIMKMLYSSCGIDISTDRNEIQLTSCEYIPDSEIKKLALYKNIVKLIRYAYFGIDDIHWGDFADNFLGPHGLIPASFQPAEIKGALQAADARSIIDNGYKGQSVTQKGLAALAGVSVKTLKNLLTPAAGGPLRSLPDGRIPVVDARRWLKSRPNFRETIRVDGSLLDVLGTEDEAANGCQTLNDIRFVPVARDGSLFSPEYKRDGRYLIGPKDQEWEFDDYQEALSALTTMEVPRWRRPNARGRWRVVVGIRWIRCTLAELGLEEGATPCDMT